MSAKHRFVVGSWLLLASVCLALSGKALWSGVDAHHHVTEPGPYACLLIMGEECKPPSHIVTAPNRIPAVALLIIGGTAGTTGAFLMRWQPRRAASHDSRSSR